MAKKRRTNKRRNNTKSTYSRKTKGKKRSIKKRKYNKKGGSNEEWRGSEFPPGSNLSKDLARSMGVEQPSFQEQQALGPLTECQSLECKKRRAEMQLEKAKQELEMITGQLNDAIIREQMNKIYIPIQNAINEISNISSKAVSYSSKKIRDKGKKLGIQGTKGISKGTRYGAKKAAALANKSGILGPEQRIAIQRGVDEYVDSAERFEANLDQM